MTVTPHQEGEEDESEEVGWTSNLHVVVCRREQSCKSRHCKCASLPFLRAFLVGTVTVKSFEFAEIS